MPSAINQLVVAELAKRFHAMPNAILVDFTGLNAPQADELRAGLGRQGAGMMVVKNSLAILALRQLELLEVAELVDGPTAFVYGDDPVALCKTLQEWGRKVHGLKARGGLVAGRAVDASGVAALAALPPLQVLRAQLVGAIGAPLSGFVGVLQGVLRNFVGAVKAVAEKKEQG
jgi:large subunit ribosomal protein L10